MSDNSVQITINAVDKASGVFKAFTGVSLSSFTSVAGAVGLATTAIKAAIDWYKKGTENLLKYGEATESFARLSGMSAIESQKLIILSQRLDVSTDALARGMKQLALSGIAPTTDNLADLSTEYRAIQDPVEKATFLQEKFGKSGQELAKIFDLTAQELKALNKEISENSTLTKTQLDQIQELETAQNRLKVAEEAHQRLVVANTLSLQAWGAANKAYMLEGLNSVTIANNRVEEAQKAGLLTTEDLIGLAKELGFTYWDAGLVLTNYGRIVDLIDQKYNAYMQSVAAAESTWGTHNFLLDNTVQETTKLADAIQYLSEKDMINIGIQGTLKDATEAQTEAFLYQKISANLDADAALQLAKNMGIMDEKTYASIKIMDELNRKYDNGQISAGMYASQVNSLAGYLNSIPGTVVSDVIVNTWHYDFYNEDWRPTKATDRRTQQGAPAEAKASGGPVSGGVTYLVGEQGPELFTPNQGGNITPNNKLGNVAAEISNASMLKLANMIGLKMQEAMSRNS